MLELKSRKKREMTVDYGLIFFVERFLKVNSQ